MLRSLSTLLILLSISSCSTIQRWAVRSNSDLFDRAGSEEFKESDWDFFRDSAPANLKMVELLALQDPANLLLKKNLIKGYFTLSFSVFETLYLEEKIIGETDLYKKRSIIHYTRALDYGVDYLSRRNISREELLLKSENDLRSVLDARIKSEDYSALLYFAFSWANLIYLQKDDISLNSQLSRVNAIADWACDKDPQIETGLCDLFENRYVKTEKLYLGSLEKFPRNQLLRLELVENIYLPKKEVKKYDEQVEILKEEFAKWDQSLTGRLNLKNESSYRGAEGLNLFNAVARKRFEIIQKYKTKLF